jgi:hypothetical protein
MEQSNFTASELKRMTRLIKEVNDEDDKDELFLTFLDLSSGIPEGIFDITKLRVLSLASCQVCILNSSS